jgi:phospholipid/cholesterol/gamma-HCH transport system substrate-binding protein
LGGAHIALTPGGAEDDLKPGAEISNTQGSVDLFGLIGQMLRPRAAAAAPAADNAASSAESPASGY